MNINQYLEQLLLFFNIKTEIDVILFKNNQIIYFLGDSEKCTECLYQIVTVNLKEMIDKEKEYIILQNEECVKLNKSNDAKYQNQLLYHLSQELYLIFGKTNDTFSEEELSYIKSIIYFVNKIGLIDKE